MKTKITIVLVLLLAFLPKGDAQEYYSKILRGIQDRTFLLQPHLTEEGDKLVTPLVRNKTDEYMDTGWLLTDLYGEAIDSFFYKEFYGSHSKNTSVLKGDTLFLVLQKPIHNHKINVFGSSISQRDSLFKWVYDKSDLTTYISPQRLFLNSRGNLVILSRYFRTHVSLHMLELTMEGEVVLDKVIHVYDDVVGVGGASYDSDVSAHIMEKDGLYYTLQVVGDKYRILCFDMEGNVQWVTEPRKGKTAYLGYGRYNDISFNHDSTELYVAHSGYIEFGDFYPEELIDSGDYIVWFSDTVETFYYERMQISVYDLEGEELRRHSQFFKFPGGDRQAQTSELSVSSSKTSRYNGDLMVTGVWQYTEKLDQFQYNMGLYFRMSPDGEDVRVYKVLDRFGHPHIFGAGLSGINEDKDGNVYLSGWIHNSWKPPYKNAGWLVRLGIDPCEGMHCRGDTLSGHTFLTSSDELKVASRTTEYLSVSPNPAVAGGEVVIGRRSGEVMDVSGDAVLLSSDGVLLRRYRPEELLRSGGRLILPSYLPPGMYYLNMRKGDSYDRYVAKVMVVE